MSACNAPRVYDAIRLARGKRAGGLIFVLACYLDDSDATISKVLTIAGYVADAEGWARFEAEAEAICAEYKVDLIRGLNLDQRKKCFDGWSLPKIERFLERIGAAMRGNVLHGISRSITKERYKAYRQGVLKLDAEHRRVFGSLSAFGFAFGNILLEFRNNNQFGIVQQVKDEGIAFMLESGSANNPDILRYIDSERRHGNIHVNTTATEVDKRSCRAIQIADLYAFYSRRRMNKFSRFRGRLEFVPDLHQLHVKPKIPHDTAWIEEPGILGTNVRTGEIFRFHGLTTRPTRD